MKAKESELSKNQEKERNKAQRRQPILSPPRSRKKSANQGTPDPPPRGSSIDQISLLLGYIVLGHIIHPRLADIRISRAPALEPFT